MINCFLQIVLKICLLPTMCHIIYPPYGPRHPTLVLGGVLTSCKTEYKLVFEDVTVEEIVEECDTIMLKKCWIEESRKCSLEYRRNCSKRTKKVCRTVKTNKCSPSIISACKPKYTRKCDHQWQVRGDIELLEEVPGSCKQVEVDQDGCNTKLEDVKRGTVCKKRPKRICEWTQTDVKCKEKPENVCETKPGMVCKKEPETECKNVARKRQSKVSRRVPTKICR